MLANRPRFVYLDFARAVAAFAVFNQHYIVEKVTRKSDGSYPTVLYISSFLTDGLAAVSFFFVLSGFVLSARGKDKRAFYVERFFRIYPSYAFVLFFSVIAFFARPHADVSWLHIVNVFQAVFLCGGVNKWFGPFVPQAWTLVYEFMFAAFLPFISPGEIEFQWFFAIYVLTMGFFGLISQFTLNSLYFLIGVATRKHINELSDAVSKHTIVTTVAATILYHLRLCSIVLVPAIGLM
jgi:peptidoglycan/LPS O-acetylase OafA/YrhL